MNGEIQIRRRHNVRRLAFVTIAAVAVFLLLKPESASGGGDGRHSPVARRLAREPQTRIPDAGGRRATLQRIVRRLVAGGAPGALAFVRTPAGAAGVAAGYADLKQDGANREERQDGPRVVHCHRTGRQGRSGRGEVHPEVRQPLQDRSDRRHVRGHGLERQYRARPIRGDGQEEAVAAPRRHVERHHRTVSAFADPSVGVSRG